MFLKTVPNTSPIADTTAGAKSLARSLQFSFMKLFMFSPKSTVNMFLTVSWTKTFFFILTEQILPRRRSPLKRFSNLNDINPRSRRVMLYCVISIYSFPLEPFLSFQLKSKKSFKFSVKGRLQQFKITQTETCNWRFHLPKEFVTYRQLHLKVQYLRQVVWELAQKLYKYQQSWFLGKSSRTVHALLLCSGYGRIKRSQNKKFREK